MPSRQPRKTQKAVRSDSEGGVALQSSYDQVDDMLKTARNMISSSKKRRAAKRKSIEDEYEKKTKDMVARINSLFEARKHRVTKLQRSQWDRLDALNKRRSALESLILVSMRSIEQHTMNISSELSAMFEGRIEEIQGSSAPQKT